MNPDALTVLFLPSFRPFPFAFTVLHNSERKAFCPPLGTPLGPLGFLSPSPLHPCPPSPKTPPALPLPTYDASLLLTHGNQHSQGYNLSDSGTLFIKLNLL